MNLADICLKCINSENPSLEYIAMLEKIVIEKTEPEKWQDAYWLAVWVDKFYNNESINDSYIIRLLEKSMENGLNYHANPELFLEASMMLAKLLFKYQKFLQAENYLLLIRELTSEQDITPNWIQQYSAVTFYKLQLNSILSDPKSFFNAVDLIQDIEKEKRQQKIFLIKDFLNSVTTYVNESNLKAENLQTFINKSNIWIQPYLHDVNTEWQELISTLDLSFDSSILDTDENQWLNMQINILKIKTYEHQNQLDELSAVIEDLYKIINEQLLNSTGALSREQTKVTPPEKYISTSKTPKILVFGSSKLSTGVLSSIAKTMGFEKNQFVFMTDYDNNKNFNFKDIRYHSPYSGILIGPVAHKIAGIGNYSSVIQMLKNEEGFPHVEEIRTSGGDLKITKTSFKNALRKMVTHWRAIGIEPS